MIEPSWARIVMRQAIEKGWAAFPEPPETRKERLAQARKLKHANAERQKRAGEALDAEAVRAINWFCVEVETAAEVLRTNGKPIGAAAWQALKDCQSSVNKSHA